MIPSVPTIPTLASEDRGVARQSGAIVFDAATIGFGVGTFSHNVGEGNNRFLTVGVAYVSGGSTVSGITYNGVAMTRLKDISANGVGATLWGLVAPATGPNNVVISWSGAAPGFATGAVSFLGVDQTALVADSGLGATGTSSAPTSAAHTVIDGDVIIDALGGSSDIEPLAPTQTGWADGAGDGQAYRFATVAGSLSTEWTTVGTPNWSISSYAMSPA